MAKLGQATGRQTDTVILVLKYPGSGYNRRMWWVFVTAIVLIFFEYKSLKFNAVDVLNLKNYFWLITNLGILSFLVPEIVRYLYFLLEALHIQPQISLLSYPIFLQLIIFLLLIDFIKFAQHYLIHKSDFLWKAHMVHHSSAKINTLASFKYSWAEALYDIIISCILEKFLRLDLWVLMTVNSIFIYVCMWQHSDINYSGYKNRLLSFIFITPKNHRIHHEKLDHVQNKNFGFIFTFWDRAFGTFSATESFPQVFGIKESNYPYHSNLRQLFHPLMSTNQINSKAVTQAIKPL